MINIGLCRIIDLPRVGDRNGSITAINNYEELPFEAKRIFFIYDIPGGQSRGHHAHIECYQFLIALSGSFEVEVFDGKNTKVFFLNTPNKGLLVPPGIWACEQNFSSSSICLVITSHEYDELDYIRDYNKYLNYVSNV